MLLQDKKFQDKVGYGLKVVVNYEMSSNIRSISSPTHPITFEFGDNPKKAKAGIFPLLEYSFVVS